MIKKSELILSEKYLKENVFYFFDEVEYYKINKGYVKANLEDLKKMYKSAYELGALTAIDELADLTDKFRDFVNERLCK